MALEPAGVSLQAQGFDEYIKKLTQTEKKQREVFDTKFKGTSLTFQQVTKAAKVYEKQLRETDKAQKQATQSAQKLAQAQKQAATQQKAAAAAQRTAVISTASAVLGTAKQIGTFALESAQLGARFESQQAGLQNLAASFGQSGTAIEASIQTASKGTISGLDAINAANQAMLLGVAKSPAEFDKLTRTALTLGRTVGLTGTQAIEQFTTALGRQSLLILDNFGISAKQVNAEIERLAQADFGVAASKLNDAQKQATFMKAALEIAGDSASRIGEEAGKAQESFERLTASTENFKTQLGLAITDFNSALGITDRITKEINKFTEGIKEFRGGVEGAPLDRQIEATEIKIKRLEKTLTATRESFKRGGFLAFLDENAIKTQQKTLGKLQTQLKLLNFDKAVENTEKFQNTLADIPDITPVIDDNTDAIDAFAQALEQAEQLQLSFARAAEDAARQQSRATQDIERRRGRQLSRSQDRERRDRDNLLQDQQSQLDDFEQDRISQISDAESEIATERRNAGRERLRAQQQLQRQLAQQADRFRLSQLQGERRFQLSERRLRASGDILGLQELRENRELQLQEEQENFNQQQGETRSSATEQQREQERDLDERLNTLRQNLEDQRAELLTSFDEQVAAQAQQQAEQRAQLQIGFADQDQDRAISLARQEEDRRISQDRQLEDLGRSLATEQGVTAEGVDAIAGEFDRVFGTEGTADAVITGFTARTESEFRGLFENLEEIVSGASTGSMATPDIQTANINTSGEGLPLFLPGFQDGGVVPGPTGSSQIIQAHGGETVLPTHQQSFRMPAPVIPSQRLAVEMSGGFEISGGEAAGEAATQAAVSEVVDTIEIAVKRLARRN